MLGVVTALPQERAWLAGAVGDADLVVELSGIGTRAASKAAWRLVKRGATCLASWGSAAGLDPSCVAGTVVLPRTVVLPGEGAYDTDRAWHRRLIERLENHVPLSTGLLIHSVELLQTPAAKRQLFRQEGAVAADMESGAVARLAAEHELPFVAIRVVLDAAGTSLPRAIAASTDEEGRLLSGALCRRALCSPEDWPRFVRLALSYRVAGRAMRTTWQLASPNLLCPDHC